MITGRRGAAAFADDVPLPDTYRLDDASPDFQANALALIDRLLGDEESFLQAWAEQRRPGDGAVVIAAGDDPVLAARVGLAEPDAITGKYVQRLQLADGAILITFGGNANLRIKGDVLAYVPEETGAGANLIWHCDTARTTVPNKYRPQVCRN